MTPLRFEIVPTEPAALVVTDVDGKRYRVQLQFAVTQVAHKGTATMTPNGYVPDLNVSAQIVMAVTALESTSEPVVSTIPVGKKDVN